MRTASEMGDGVAFVDGEYVPVADAKISFFDQAVMMSDATYDVVGVCNGSFFRLEDHLERFERSMAKLRLKLPYDRAGIAGILTECVRRGGLKDAFVEMACTRGVATPGTRDLGAFTNKFVAFAVPYINLATPEIEDRGMHLFVSSVERTSPKSIDPTIKNYSRLDFITAEFETKERGADRALLLDADGHVTEGHGYNIFALCGGTLMTPAQGVLEGITRKTVLELCEETNVKAEAGDFTADQLRGADEAMITSTAGGIIPVTKVDGRPIGDGHVGPLTTRLRDLYWAKHDDPEYATPIDYDA
jgi:branched-chain amino acid aminotransferase